MRRSDDRSTMFLRMPHDLHERVKVAAEMSGKSINRWVCELLRREADKDHATSSVTNTAISEFHDE